MFTTDYFFIPLPDGHEEDYAAVYYDAYERDDTEDDLVYGEFESAHPVNVSWSLYDKEAYETHNGGRLLDIHVSQTNPYMGPEDKMLGMLVSPDGENEYFFYVTFPSDYEVPAGDTKRYEELQLTAEQIVNSISTASGYTLKDYEAAVNEPVYSLLLRYITFNEESGILLAETEDGKSLEIDTHGITIASLEPDTWYELHYTGEMEENSTYQTGMVIKDFEKAEQDDTAEARTEGVMEVYFALMERNMDAVARRIRYPIEIGGVAYGSREELSGKTFEEVLGAEMAEAAMAFEPSRVISMGSGMYIGNEEYGVKVSDVDGDMKITEIFVPARTANRKTPSEGTESPGEENTEQAAEESAENGGK